MGRDWFNMIKRGLRKPPHVIARRVIDEVSAELQRLSAPRRPAKLNGNGLLSALETQSLDQLWARLSRRAYPALVQRVDSADYDRLCPRDYQRILSAAENTLAHRVDLLGSGPVELGENIDWHKDYKSGYSWTPKYFRSIDYNNPDHPSDVKFPWELSRMQWLISAGQAYLISEDERYALAVREVLDDWIAANPYAQSVNWACTMEVALRILTWTWFFHVFHNSASWVGEDFRRRFLLALFLHGEFTEQHLERSDVNGNHYTADAAGLVFAGLFFGDGEASRRWQQAGWGILCNELPEQVSEDGVDFEGSVAYHRLVLELFFLPALYRERLGLSVPATYKEHIIAMARFSRAYSGPDGNTPLWGDADDARALPFGDQGINDHRYLPEIVGAAWHVPNLINADTGSRAELFWLLGVDAIHALAEQDIPSNTPRSLAFTHGGFYIMQNQRDHVFIDCGPVGLAGRGGHGHNDCLAFEAVLDGVRLVSDCGAYLYTASYEERNNFRSTAYHNTPLVDGKEINRFIRPDYLWNLHYDAVPTVYRWGSRAKRDVFRGSHAGYERLRSTVRPVRTIVLDHERHALIVLDHIKGVGHHSVEIPLQLAVDVRARQKDANTLELTARGQIFVLVWKGTGPWSFQMKQGRISPSYGIVVPATRLVWHFVGELGCSLLACVAPQRHASHDLIEWARTQADEYDGPEQDLMFGKIEKERAT